LRQFSFRFTGVAFVAMLVIITLAPNARTTELMPLLLPLALLAYPGLDHLKRGQSGFFDWLGIFFFGALILTCWLVWSSLYLGSPRGFILKQINAFQPGFKDTVQIVPVLLAVVLTVVWFAMIRPARRTHKRSLVNWTVAVTAGWGVFTLLLLPYLNYGKSYRIPVSEIAKKIPDPQKSCVEGIGLGPSQRAMFDYMANIQMHSSRTHACHWLIEQTPASPPPTDTRPPGYALEAVTTRPGEKLEKLSLYKRAAQ
jgi:NADH:ubiquinone oxidoreductase subunit 6 (subunit J)